MEVEKVELEGRRGQGEGEDRGEGRDRGGGRVCRWKTDLVDKLEYLLLVVCPHPGFKQAVVCKEGR